MTLLSYCAICQYFPTVTDLTMKQGGATHCPRVRRSPGQRVRLRQTEQVESWLSWQTNRFGRVWEEFGLCRAWNSFTLEVLSGADLKLLPCKSSRATFPSIRDNISHIITVSRCFERFRFRHVAWSQQWSKVRPCLASKPHNSEGGHQKSYS